MGITLGSLAELQLLRGDLDAAATTLQELLTLSTALTHAELTSTTLNLQASSTWPTRPRPCCRDIPGLPAALCPLGFWFLAAEALLGLGEAAAQQGAFTRALRFAAAASQVLAAAGQQPASFHQTAFNRVQHHVDQAIDPPAQQAIRAAGEAAPLTSSSLRQPPTPRTDTFPLSAKGLLDWLGLLQAPSAAAEVGRGSRELAQPVRTWARPSWRWDARRRSHHGGDPGLRSPGTRGRSLPAVPPSQALGRVSAASRGTPAFRPRSPPAGCCLNLPFVRLKRSFRIFKRPAAV